MARTNHRQPLLDRQHVDLRDRIQWGLVAVVRRIRMATSQHRNHCHCRRRLKHRHSGGSRRFSGRNAHPEVWGVGATLVIANTEGNRASIPHISLFDMFKQI